MGPGGFGIAPVDRLEAIFWRSSPGGLISVRPVYQRITDAKKKPGQIGRAFLLSSVNFLDRGDRRVGTLFGVASAGQSSLRVENCYAFQCPAYGLVELNAQKLVATAVVPRTQVLW